MKTLTAIAAVFLLAGCAATGPRYHEVAEKMEGVRSGQARLTVFRTTQGFSYAVRAASVKLDNRSMPSVPLGSFFIADAAPGRHSITVDLWDVPGKCDLSFEAAAGEEVFLELRPTSANPFGLAGALVEAAVTDPEPWCPGPFTITKVDKDKAFQKMQDLKQSD